MKNLILCFCLVLLDLSFFCSCSKHDDFLEYKGSYLGQEPPGSKPQLFLPGLISTNYIDHCIAFLEGGRVCVFSIWEKGTYYMYEKESRWTQPKKALWQNEPGATTDFTAGPDDRTIYFQSRRPTSDDDEKQETNIWTVEWTDEGWTAPVPLPEPANTKDYSEAYPSVDPDGTVYFFTRIRPDSRDGDIYRTRFIKDKGYLEAECFEDPINSEYYEVDPVVAPDGREFYFSIYTEGQGCKMYFTKESESGWSVPEPVSFSSQNSDVDMCVTPDGTRMYFGSTRPVNGIEQNDYKIWYVDREGEGWSKAKYLNAPINSGRRALYPSVSNSGTMYFQAVRENTFGSRDIYYSRQDESGFTEPIHLGREINSEYSEGDVFIAPDETYMIVNSSGRPDDLGNSDLYISFRKEDGSWTELKNMGSQINSPETDYCPMLSPDGKYFFFTSKRTGNGDIYWVDAKIIEDLRSKE